MEMASPYLEIVLQQQSRHGVVLAKKKEL